VKADVDNATCHTLDEVKSILLSTKVEFLHQLESIDDRTRAILRQMENMVFLPDAISRHHAEEYSDVPDTVKGAIRDLQTIVGKKLNLLLNI
jgi:hypothetical protein